MEALCTLGTLSKSKRQLAYCTLQLQIKEVQKQVAIASSCEYEICPHFGFGGRREGYLFLQVI